MLVSSKVKNIKMSFSSLNSQVKRKEGKLGN